jgi:hypothetical protein
LRIREQCEREQLQQQCGLKQARHHGTLYVSVAVLPAWVAGALPACTSESIRLMS